MQVRSFTRFALVTGIAVSAAFVGIASSAQAQELDPSETLQARSLAAQAAQHEQKAERSRAAVAAEAHNLQAAGQLKAGERADAPVVGPAPEPRALTRAEVKADLAAWRAKHRLVTGDLG